MSIWTHISGSVDLEKYPCEYNKKNDKWYLPFKKEQVSIEAPIPRMDYDGELGLGFEVNVTSYPIIKNIVEKNIKVIPHGESKVIEHFLNETKGHRSSSSQFVCSDEEKQFQKLIMDLYHEKLWDNAKYSDYERYLNIALDYVNYQENTILTIADDVRGCTSLSMLRGILEFVWILIENKIYFNNGYLYWIDDAGSKCSIDFNHDHDSIYVVYQDEEKTEATLTIKQNIVQDEFGSYFSEFEVEGSENWEEVTEIPIRITRFGVDLFK